MTNRFSGRTTVTRRFASLAFGAALVAGTALGGLVPASAAGHSAVSLEGKTIEFWIPFKEGGGSDVWARALVPLMSKHLPGNPTIVVRNNTQGGGVGGANEFHRRMEPTGEMIFGTSGSIQLPFLLQDKRVRYDYADFTPVFATPAGGVVYVRADSGIADATDVMKLADMDAKYGSQGIATLDLVPILAFDMLDLNVTPVFGMKSRSLGGQAIQRGELQVDYQTTPAYLKQVAPLVESGEMVPLFSWGALDGNGDIVRDPTFPDLPTFKEVYEEVKGEEPSGPEWEAWKAFFTAGFGSQKLIVLPKDTPEPIVVAYREAMKEMVADPEAREALRASIGDYEPITGDALAPTMEAATTVPDEAREWVTNWLSEEFNFSN